MSFRNELFYITHIENIPSIMKNGIMCYERAKNLKHKSIALEEVQERRDRKRIPNGRLLHEYVNLYFNQRNPMMYKRKAYYKEICVLSVNPIILECEGVVVSDMNAARELCKFLEPKVALTTLDFNEIYSENWNSVEFEEKYRLRGSLCAEVLIPDKVPYEYIQCAYVAKDELKNIFKEYGFDKPVQVKPYIFFR